MYWKIYVHHIISKRMILCVPEKKRDNIHIRFNHGQASDLSRLNFGPQLITDQKNRSVSNCKTDKLDPSTDLSRLPSCAEPKNTSDQATEHKHPNTILAIGTGTGGRGGDRGQAPRQHYVDCPYVATGA